MKRCCCPWCKPSDHDGLKRVSAMLKRPASLSDESKRILHEIVREALASFPPQQSPEPK